MGLTQGADSSPRNALPVREIGVAGVGAMAVNLDIKGRHKTGSKPSRSKLA